MSSSDDAEIENIPGNRIYKRKPTYVRRLNFGQSILNSNTVDRPNIFNSNKLIIDKNVAQIPITEKEDFVRKWVEAHNCTAELSCNGSNQSSPVLGVFKFKKSQTSHVPCNDEHQNGMGFKSNNDVIKQVETSPVLGSMKQRNRKRLHVSAEKKRASIHADHCVNVQKSPLFANSRSIHLQNANANRSPVLVREAYCYKRKRRRTISESDKSHKLNAIKIEKNDHVDTNLNLLLRPGTSKYPNSLSPEICNSTAVRREKSLRNKEIYNEKENMVIRSPLSSIMVEKNMITEKKLRDKFSPIIESVSSDDSNPKYIEIADVNSIVDDTLSDIIEDVDTQETIPLPKISECKASNKWIVESPKDSDETFYSKAESNKNMTLIEMKNKWPVSSSNGSDKTFFSKAESILSVPAIFPSNYSVDKISQVTAISTESIDSNETNFVISNATSPVRTNSRPAMRLHIIDSCKKKRRVKKKSLAGKLQSLISKQTSFVRMWHHQMKQADTNGISMPHVVVYVDKCTVYMYRQFLEGIILDDPFNLLNNDQSNEKSELSSTKLSSKRITMIVIPDIVGKIEMESESVIKIYPPWDIMDGSKMILNITYIKIMSNEQKDLILSKVKIPDRKKEKELIKEFECPCLEADKILSSCKERLNNEKPDVMEALFKF